MKTENSTEQIYIVISQTSTLVSKVLKYFTHTKYNHVSISLSDDLEQMYSFGRIRPYNPFWGGFVMESPYFGTFKRFSDTKVIVLAVDIDADKYAEQCEKLQKMYADRRHYHYNYPGLFLAAFHIRLNMEHCYYCSEFVRKVLQDGQVNGLEILPSIVQPIHFLNIPHKMIYCGKLSDYQYHQNIS